MSQSSSLRRPMHIRVAGKLYRTSHEGSMYPSDSLRDFGFRAYRVLCSLFLSHE